MQREPATYFTTPLFKVPAVVARFRLDELATIVLLNILAAIFGEYATPFCRKFSWDDLTISRPFATSEMFPNWTLPLIVILPMIASTFFAMRFPMWGRWDREAVTWFFFQLVSFTIQFVFVQFLKVFTGRLRPDFLSRLERAGFSSSSTVDFCDVATWTRETRDGRLSFPSGHASTTFGAFVPVCLFLMVYLRPFAGGGSFHRLAIVIFPACLPCIVAVSRTRDYRHNYDDIFAGSFIGIVAAALSFAMHFKSLPDGTYTIRHTAAEADGALAEVAAMEEAAVVAPIPRE
jgi:diacylglycerol diphosphate phosphatase/phosphatidate phosphatase